MRINVFKSGGNSAQGGFVSNGLSLQGPLILSGPHSEPLHAVPKQYVDNAAYNLDAGNITSGILASARMPAFSGDASTILGSTNIILSNTGVTPGSITKPTVDAKGRVTGGGSITDADINAISFGKINVNKPTTTVGFGITDAVRLDVDSAIDGNLILHSNPTSDGHAATKQYVDTAAGQAGGISIGDVIRKPYSTTPSGFLKCNGAEVDKTTFAALYSVIGDRFAASTTPGCGKPWQHQYMYNKSQTTDLTGWTAGTNLPSVVSHCSIVVTKNRVYTLGGYNGSAGVSVVYTAPINSDGTLGTWVAGTSLPVTLLAATTFVTKNRVFLCGGASSAGATYQSAVYSAPINADGTLGAWASAPSLPGAQGYHRVVVTKNRVYSICGHNGSASLSTIYTTTINDDGTINNWSVHGSFAYAANNISATVIKDRLYVFGGGRLDVYYAPIDADGVIGTWTQSMFLPKIPSYCECVTTNTRLYVFLDNEVYSAVINNDSTLGTWSKDATLAYPMGDTRPVITNSKIYLISSAGANGYQPYVSYASFLGGYNDYSGFYGGGGFAATEFGTVGNGKPWQQQYAINTTYSGSDITGWTQQASANIALNLEYPNIVVTKNKVYVIGIKGNNNVAYSTTINSNGTLTAWTQESFFTFGKLYGSSVITTKNRIYILGGQTGNAVTTSIYTAAINADGTLGSITLSSISLPIGLAFSQSFIVKNRLYICGGSNNTSSSNADSNIVSNVYSTTIDVDGFIGSFTAETALPTALAHAAVAVTSDRVYLIGGFNGTAGLSTVYYAIINSDGTLGSWAAGTALPSTVYRSGVYVAKNRVYLLGGRINGSNSSTVHSAPINADGTLGSWAVMATSLSGSEEAFGTFVSSSYIFELGGINSNRCYYAALTGGSNDYTSYYDGTYAPVVSPNYSIAGSGRPWEQQYQLNTAQITDITGWTTSTPMTNPVSQSVCFVTKNRVYIVGSYTAGSYIATINTAPINADGTIGTWTTAGSAPHAFVGASVAFAKNRVYLLGGYTGSAYTSAIYYAPINSDGTIGSIVNSGVILPQGCTKGVCFVTKNKLYHIGGYSGGAHTGSIYVSTILSDGSLTAFTAEGSYPINTYASVVAVTKNFVYIIAGHNGSTNVQTVYYASINSDGSLGSWTLGNNLPGSISWGHVHVTAGKVYVIAGYTGSNVVSTVYHATINADGTLGTWVTGTAIPGTTNGGYTFAVKNKIYVLGGNPSNGANAVTTVYSATINTSTASDVTDYSPYYDGTISIGSSTINYTMPGSGQPWKNQYQINQTQLGDITGWANGTSLPGATGHHSCFVTKNRVYIVGGFYGGSNVGSTVYTAPINGDGTLGTWATGTAYPTVIAGAAPLVYKNRVYLLGGSTNGNNAISSIYTAPINADGTIGSWTLNSSALPVGLNSHQAVIIKNNIWVIGGHNGSAYTSGTYVAPINSDGSIGTWVAGNTLPFVVANHQIAVTLNRIYLITGYSSASHTGIATASVNSDGSIGTWSLYGTSLPAGMSHTQMVVTKNYLYVFGGYTSSVSFAGVWRTTLDANGAPGSWTSGSSMPYIVNAHSIIVVNGKVHSIGGRSDGSTAWFANVSSATFSSTIQDYSPYYDGTIEPVSTASTKFKLPDYSMIDREFGESVTSYIKF